MSKRDRDYCLFEVKITPFDPWTEDTLPAVTISGRKASDRKLLYRALAQMEWLPARIRTAAMAEIGQSLRDHNVKQEAERTKAMRQTVDELVDEGWSQADAIEEVAATVTGMKASTLKKRLQRLG
jgi:hypothetical protein